MMYWNYHCMTITGKEIKDKIYGNKDEVLQFLKRSSLEVITIHPDYLAQVRFIFKRKKLSAKTLGAFFEEFHDMLETGLGLKQILDSLHENTSNSLLNETLLDIDRHITRGFSLAESFKETGHFSWIVVSALSAGEKAGRLSAVMEALTKHYKRELEMNEKFINALSYPVLVGTLLFSAMFYISLFVIPKLQTLLPVDMHKSPATVFVVMLSAIIRHTWFLGAGATLAAVIFVSYFKRRFPIKFESFLYKIPLLGPILKERDISLYFLNLSILQYSGVPILESLKLLHKVNKCLLSEKFLNCHDFILGGTSLWEAIARDDFFPLFISNTVRKGEEQASLDTYFERISQYYSKRVNSQTDRLIASVQPTLIILCAVFLAVIGLSVIFPIYSNLSTIAGGG